MNKIIIFAIISFSFNAFAINKDAHLNKLNYCNISKTAINDYEPVTFERTNNLLRKTGQEAIYCGEKIIVRGVVLDQNCAPVSDAKIYAWQANCSGKYPYEPLKTRIDEDLINVDDNLTFTGNGTATTNNKGEFYFITVYPLATHEKLSHINIRVEHHRLGNLQTKLTFRGSKVKNPTLDPQLNSISQQAERDGSSIYNFEIVIPGESLKSY